MKVTVKIAPTTADDKSSTLLKKTWEGCSCQEITKFNVVIRIILAGMMINC